VAATDITATDSTAEAFAAWLPHGLADVARVRHALTEAQSTTTQVRAALAAARTAEATIESLLQRRSERGADAAERESQAFLDETGITGHRQAHAARSARGA
jgi:hypothetical protein